MNSFKERIIVLIIVLFVGLSNVTFAQEKLPAPSGSESEKKSTDTSGNSVRNFVEEIKKSIVFLGEFRGEVNYLNFLVIKEIDEDKAKAIVNDLINHGYLDVSGRILSNFKPFEPGFNLVISPQFEIYKINVKDILTKQLKKQYVATGFLVKVRNFYHLVTAKHVAINPRTGEEKDANLYVFFNDKQGMVKNISITSLKNLGFKWIFHSDRDVDIAIIPFYLKDDFDIKFLPETIFFPVNRIMELLEVFFLSYQPGIDSTDNIDPVIRQGMVSMVNDNKTFYIDGFAFPGNSGSPVFLKFDPIGVDENGEAYFINIKKGLGIRFLGILGAYVPYQEIAFSKQSERPRVVFEENTGLSKVWTADYLNELIESSEFRQQIDKLVSLQTAIEGKRSALDDKKE